jgi:amino acid transporter
MGNLETTHTRLKANALNFWEVLAQAIALISPTMTAVLIVPLMFGVAGTAGWLCYLLGTVMLLFVALSLNQFARRYTSAGSMYEYAVKGLGPRLGGVAGWCLIWAYLFIGIAGVTGFTHFATKLLTLAGVAGEAPMLSIAGFAVCVATAWLLAVRDITFATILVLILEGVSVAVILLLAGLSLAHPIAAAAPQLDLGGHGLKDIGLGTVVAIFSLVGFECATAFGEETKRPLVTIPRGVVASLLITGGFFVLVSYVETRALAAHVPPLDQLDAPLSTLSAELGVGWLGIAISFGAMLSFFALALSCMNAGARLIFTMGRHGLFPAALGRSHERHLTPHIAVSVFAIVQLTIPTVFTAASYAGLGGWQMAPIDAFNDAGLFGAMGFLASYVLISIAAPLYLRMLGELKRRNLVISAIALVLLTVPIVGTVYPEPAYPMSWFPYIFGAYVAVGIGLVLTRSRSAAELDVRRHMIATRIAPHEEQSAA